MQKVTSVRYRDLFDTNEKILILIINKIKIGTHMLLLLLRIIFKGKLK